MESLKSLAGRMFPDICEEKENLEARFPQRKLPEGAAVTRFAPSPTGFLHIGGLFAALVAERVAKQSNGAFYLRIEDTDKKREVDGGVALIVDGLRAYGIQLDEGALGEGEEQGSYGPYRQSMRASIYHVYAKWMVEQGLAYPCFCSQDELLKIRKIQEGEKLRTGYYAQYASCRDIAPDQAIMRIDNGEPYVVRLRSPGKEENRIRFKDLIKGDIEMPENDQDIVLLKTDGIPTYHFAHAVDDHLMRTTTVIRGDEWISSVNIHLQLFRLLGFKPPKYAHIAPIMKEEAGGKRKLSKRKDPEAAMSYYIREGYPAESVTEYLLTIASSDYEDWRRTNKQTPFTQFRLNLKKMSISGALFDLPKLEDVSRGVIAQMTAQQVFDEVLDWAKREDAELYRLFSDNPAYAKEVLSIDRGGAKPRKDIAKWSDVKNYLAYFYDQLFESRFELPENISPRDAAAILDAYIKTYTPEDDRDGWWNQIKGICGPLGFSPDIKAFKKNSGEFKGHVGDLSTVIRLAVTARKNTPDLYSIMKVLGPRRVLARLENAKKQLETV